MNAWNKWFRGIVAALGLAFAAGAAHAQLDYSLYGVADISYGRFEPSGFEHEDRWNSNSLSASFIGVNANYGFDGGWKPGITLETFIRFQDFDTGRNDNDPFFSRNAFVSLGSNYGTLRIGRQQTFLFDTTTRFNALGNSVPFSPAVRQVFGGGNLESVQRDFYWDRAVGYVSPNLEGATGSVMYALGPNHEHSDLFGANVVYSRGVFAAEISLQDVHFNDGINDLIDEQAWQLGLTYNFGWARLFGLYTHTNDKGLDVRSNLYSGGAAVPLGPGILQFQVGYSEAKGPAVDRKHTQVGAAYLYAYNSVLDIYVIGLNDRIRGQTDGVSFAIGARYRF